MITQLDLTYFKCFEQLKLPLRNLTLLSGTNASGKTSVLHALVLLHQTMREHEWSSRLMLNGDSVRLGTAADVLDQVYGHRVFGIAIHDRETDSYAWEFEGGHEDMSLEVRKAWGESDRGGEWNFKESEPLRFMLPFQAHPPALVGRLRGLTYLTAERLGPREYYAHQDLQRTPVVGSNGEFAASLLQSGRDVRVLPELVIPEVPSTRFRQVEGRMARLFPGCALEIEPVPRLNIVTLGIRVSSDSGFHRPVHTGFGLTQVFPIIVAALSAQKADILLIENPEVHLHPAGQVAIGCFLAEVAASGIQVVTETHSDHVLNGVRRAVKEGILSHDQLAVHFFRSRNLEGPQVQSPQVDQAGNVDSWPDGFFDQFDKDMNYFAGWG